MRIEEDSCWFSPGVCGDRGRGMSTREVFKIFVLIMEWDYQVIQNYLLIVCYMWCFCLTEQQAEYSEFSLSLLSLHSQEKDRQKTI